MRFSRFCLIYTIATCIVSCGKNVDLSQEEVLLDCESLELYIGQSAIINVVGGSLSETEWCSSDVNVAVVDDAGIVNAVGEGIATISAFSGRRSASAVVYVSALKADSVVLNAHSLILKQGDVVELGLSVVPEDIDLAVSWESESEQVASIYDGKITAVSEGFTCVKVTVGNLSDTCMVTVVSVPQIGDYFYSDGSWLTEYVSGKELSGIVFWTGNPSEVDPVLREEHPECTNGLVVSLYDEECSWQSNNEDYSLTIAEWLDENAPEFISTCARDMDPDILDNILGYNNSSAILQFNLSPENNSWKSDVIKRLLFFRNDPGNHVEETTSGWYMPSAKELSLLCSGEVQSSISNISGTDVDIKIMVNEKIKECDKGTPIKDALYWSSTEYDEKNSISVNFKSGAVPYNLKRYGNLNVRYILAF